MDRVFILSKQDLFPLLFSLFLFLSAFSFFGIKLKIVRLFVVNTSLNLVYLLLVLENCIKCLHIGLCIIARCAQFHQRHVALRLLQSFGHVVVCWQEIGELFGVRIQPSILDRVKFLLNLRHFQEIFERESLFKRLLLPKARIIDLFGLQTACHVFSEERVEVLLSRVSAKTSSRSRDIITEIVQTGQVNILGQNLGNFVVHFREIVRVIVNQALLCLRQFLLGSAAQLSSI